MSTLKDIVKNSFLGDWIFRRRRVQRCKRYIRAYENQFCRLSSTNMDKTDEGFIRLRLVLIAHSLEKGLCHKNFKAGFGKAAVIELCEMVNSYMAKEGKDEFALANAISVLSEYHRRNQEAGFDDTEYLKIPFVKSETNYGTAGSKPYILSDKGEERSFTFKQFAFSRSSVRLFEEEGETISKEELWDCIKTAQTAPNACNRQSIRIHVVLDKSKFPEIERLQLGCRGFGSNASAFVFITNDLGLYESNEFKLPIFEAGVFTMNLVYAMHEKGLYSCILNASFPNDTGNEIYKIAEIPASETINGLIAVYKKTQREEVGVPASLRRKTEEITSFVE